MKSILFALCAITTMFSLNATASDCEPGVLSSSSSPICGLPETKAYHEALKKGLDADIQRLKTFYNREATCNVKSAKAIRLAVKGGNHGKGVSVLILTEVVCTSKFFVALPLFQFPIIVKMWSSHDENEVSDLELQKLYDPNDMTN